MEDDDIAVYVVEAADRLAGLVRAGIAAGREHHRECGVVAPAYVDAVERAVGDGEHDLEQVAFESRQQRLRLRIAEARVELDDARAVGRDEDAGVEDALERRAFGRHCAHGGLRHVAADRFGDVIAQPRWGL